MVDVAKIYGSRPEYVLTADVERYMALIVLHWDSISAFKEAVQNERKEAAEAALMDIPDNDLRVLWRTQTPRNRFGGVFTPDEHRFIKMGRSDG